MSRYDLKGARMPAPVLGLPADDGEIAIVAVPDPWQDAYGPRTERVQATVRVDLLERELACGNIDEAAYYAGREIQRVLEIESRIHPQSLWSDAGRVDNGGELDAPGRALEAAFEVESLRDTCEGVQQGSWAFLAALLGGSWTFSLYGRVTGIPRKTVARHFRRLLMGVADALGAVGPTKGSIRVLTSANGSG